MIERDGRLYPSPKYSDLKYREFVDSASDEVLLRMLKSEDRKDDDVALYLSKDSILDLEQLIETEINDSRISITNFIKKPEVTTYDSSEIESDLTQKDCDVDRARRFS